MKGISTIIAAILLVVITIGLVGTAYLFVGGVLTEQISNVISLVDAKGHRITIRNDGTKSIESDEIKIDVNGQEAEIANPRVIEPKQSATLKFVPPDFGDELRSAKVNILGPSNVLSYTTDFTPHELKVTSDTVALWNFNEASGNETHDSSPNNNNGNFTGETFNDGTLHNFGSGWTGDCKFGSCLKFDGYDDYAEVLDPGASSLDITDEITIEGWFYLAGDPDTTGGNDYRFMVHKSWGAYHILLEQNRQICVSVYNTTGSRYGFWTGYYLPIREWHHLAYTYESSAGEMKFYVDGNFYSSQSFIPDTIQTNNNALRISNPQATPPKTWNGTIDEVRIFDRVLTEDEIKTEMESSRPTIRPVAAWSFEECSGQVAKDSHIWMKGKFDSALSFDGNDDWVNVTPDAMNGLVNFTLEYWMKTSDTTKDGTVIMGTNTGNNEFIMFNYRSLSPVIKDGFWNTGIALNDGKWHHVALTRNGDTGEIKLYIDGEFKGSSIKPTGALVINCLVLGQEQDAVCGGFDINQAFLGLIDEMRISNRTLTQEEILDSIYG